MLSSLPTDSLAILAVVGEKSRDKILQPIHKHFDYLLFFQPFAQYSSRDTAVSDVKVVAYPQYPMSKGEYIDRQQLQLTFFFFKVIGTVSLSLDNPFLETRKDTIMCVFNIFTFPIY